MFKYKQHLYKIVSKGKENLLRLLFRHRLGNMTRLKEEKKQIYTNKTVYNASADLSKVYCYSGHFHLHFILIFIIPETIT